MILTGRPSALYILDYGLFRVHANGRVIGLVGFLVKTDAGEEVLIDTGLPPKYAGDGIAAGLEDGLDAFGEVVSVTEENLPEVQLERAQSGFDQIDLMILSHSHIDHIGALAAAPQAPMLVAEAERALPRPLYWQGAQPMEWPDRSYITVTEDTEIGPGFSCLMVPGHAPGQLAFELELPETGPVLLTSDAISRATEIDEGFDGSWDPEAAEASARRLITRANETGAMLIYGHDPEQWPGLPKAPNAMR